MTPSTKPVTRLTTAFVMTRGARPLVATIQGGLLILRPKGMRTEETVDLSAVYYMAVKARVSREKAAKKKRK